jgi:hypothetical protein
MVDEIFVGVSGEVWDALEPEIVAALDARTFTVRDEPIFHVSYVHPADSAWSRLRHMRQILLMGSAEELLIDDAIDRRAAGAPTRAALYQLPDVWAENQLVTIALLPDSADPDELRPLLPAIREAYLSQLDRSVGMGMSVTPANQRLSDRLRAEAGFALDLPYGYDEQQPEPELFVFREEETGSAPVIRTIIVDSRPRSDVDWTAEAARTWRVELAGRVNEPPQVIETLSNALQGHIVGQPTIQIRGVWSASPGEWPSAGPFITRMIECPGRVYLIDASLYAPADRKYRDMFRLDGILDSFRCSTPA